jgi:hypothetical protein
MFLLETYPFPGVALTCGSTPSYESLTTCQVIGGIFRVTFMGRRHLLRLMFQDPQFVTVRNVNQVVVRHP